MTIPFLRPSPPSLSTLTAELVRIEDSGVFTNYGPTNERFERALQDRFDDGGACVTVCNATIGLMLAIRAVLDRQGGGGPMQPWRSRRRYALMPSFTFAAAAQAATWAGLTPLFCDIDENDWAAAEPAEEALIARYGDEIAVIVPYATFGNCIDLDRYERLAARTGIPVVVDAAASLGSLDSRGRAYGAGFSFPIVYSMHATKTFSTAEGGIIHSADPDIVAILHAMGNFGFGSQRSATMPGLNAKLSEIGALLALARLQDFEPVVAHRARLARHYRALLPGWTFQGLHGLRQAYQFMPVLLDPLLDGRREEVVAAMSERGIGVATYFSPHVMQQPFFRARSLNHELPVTDMVSRRMLCLPLWDEMDETVVAAVCQNLRAVCSALLPPDHAIGPFGPLPVAAGVRLGTGHRA